MTESKGPRSGGDRAEPSQALSNSSRAAALQDDLPPSYSEQSGSRETNLQATAFVPEKRSSPPRIPQRDPREAGPTTTQPFHFPTNAVPSYAAFDAVQRPLAIPQFQPLSTSPFLSAYPVCLLSFGIPDESWRSFVDTVSAFLSAAIGAQAIHHATDLAYTLGEAHKDWALSQQDRVYSLGRKAQRGDLFGVIGGAVGLTFGTAGHIVDSVLKFPGRLTKKPTAPRDRADAYVLTANKDWLNPRGLHARIVDTVQLADVAGVAVSEFVESAKRTRSVGEQFGGLYKYIAEMDLGDGQDVREKSDKARLPITAAPPLEISKATLWLTLLKLDEEDMMLARQEQS